jgi:hypothetical protein
MFSKLSIQIPLAPAACFTTASVILSEDLGRLAREFGQNDLNENEILKHTTFKDGLFFIFQRTRHEKLFLILSTHLYTKSRMKKSPVLKDTKQQMRN